MVAGAITEDEAAEACQLRKLGNFTSVTSVIKNLPRPQQQVAECYLGLGIMFDNSQVVYKMTPIPHGAMEVAHLFHKPKKTLTCKSCKEMCKGCKGSGDFHLRSFLFRCFNDIHSMFQTILPPFAYFAALRNWCAWCCPPSPPFPALTPPTPRTPGRPWSWVRAPPRC